MKKIVFIGDSINEMLRNYQEELVPVSYGFGYVLHVAGELAIKYPGEYEIYNKAVGGQTVSHVYAHAKMDCWRRQPSVITVGVGVNDVMKEFFNQVGLDKRRYEQVYRALLQDTKVYCKNASIILLEPYCLQGSGTKSNYEEVRAMVEEYAEIVRKLAKEFGCEVVSMQKLFDEYAERYSPQFVAYDGVHPTVAGSKLIAEEWLKAFEKVIG